jgi:hypothetical protein
MNRVSWFAGASALALSAVVVVGCVGSAGSGPTALSQSSSAGTTPASSTPATASSSDPCTLITSQEASTALGVDAGTPNADAGQCTYTTASGSLTIVATHYPDGSTAQSSFDATRTAAMGGVPGFQDVTGIGAHAFLTNSGLVEFEKGPIVVIIQVLSAGNPTDATMTGLGQAAASRV